MNDAQRWYLHIAGQENDVDAGLLRDLVRVLQRPEVRAALLLMEEGICLDIKDAPA